LGELGYFSLNVKPTHLELRKLVFSFSTEICGTVATVAPIDPLFGASLQHSVARNAAFEPLGG
jgi:hypothetical protein